MTPDREAAAALLRRPGIARVMAVLDGGGEETRIVGGAVRNALLGRPVADIDLATTALPVETTRRAEAAGLRAIPTGLPHGTVTVLASGQPFEVTTLREDVDTDGRHAVVRFGRSFEADALRRDFTINAMSMDRAGTIHDVTAGLVDLAAGRVRFIGEARTRIREDFLRTLRFFRFTAEYADGPPDPEGLRAAIAERDGLRRLSRERVRSELLKLLAARRGPEIALALQDAGLLGRLVAGIGDAGRLCRAAAADTEAPDAARRLAAFLVRTPEDAESLREELRLSNAEAARLGAYATALAGLVSRAGPLEVADARRLVVTVGVEAARDATAVLATEPRPCWSETGARELDDLLSGRKPPPRFGLTGADLQAAGVPPGPELGRKLRDARAAWLAAGCPDG